MKKFLVVGLGNPGAKYEYTRHNIGFKVLDELAKRHDATWNTGRLGEVAEVKIKGRSLTLIKPNTFMNLSGKAVQHWLAVSKITPDRMLVITDDLNLDYGTIRIKGKGSDGGHNGLKDIQDKLKSNQYPRLRFGIGARFSKGRQVDYVLGNWTDNELYDLGKLLEVCCDATESFALAGMANTMNKYNGDHLADA